MIIKELLPPKEYLFTFMFLKFILNSFTQIGKKQADQNMCVCNSVLTYFDK